MTNKKKICIFCGDKPERKNKEHVIPKWLIELTGDSKREAFFGGNVSREKRGIRMYSFDSFTFPACEKCNTEFATLEGATKPIVIKILQNGRIDSCEITTFLDWLDKARIGLWLAFYYLNKNWAGISPKFHIKTRIGTRDRFLIIYKTNYNSSGINFIGAEGLSFQHSPSCFALIINNLIFFNVSTFDLCDRRLGFPFSQKTTMANRIQIEMDMVEGFQRVSNPVMRQTFLTKGIILFQPIFKEQIKNAEGRKLYNNEYVRTNSLNYEEGIGKVFIENNGSTHPLSAKDKLSIVPDRQHDYLRFLPKLSKMTFDYQLHLFQMPSPENLSSEEKKEFKLNMKAMKQSNETFLKIINQQIAKKTQQI